MFRKRLDYGLHGYQVPPIPRAARSARRRGPIFRKKVQDNQMCAFDLLATVAGKLLEGESFALATTLTPKDEGQRVDAQENDTEDQNEGVLRASDDKVNAQENDTEDQSEGVLRAGDDKVNPGINLPVNEVISSVQDHYCRETVVGMGTGKSEMGCHSSKLSDSDKKNFGCHLRKLGGSYTSSCGHVSCVVPNIEDCITPVMSSMPVDIGHVSFGTGPDTCGLEDPKLCPNRKSTIIGSYSNGNGTSLCKENCSIVSCTVSRDNLKVISRDNDENFSVCSGRSMKIRKSRSVSHIGNRRVRKLLASRCWSVASKMKSRYISDNGGEFQSIYHSRKTGYKRRRSHWFYPLKKRKFFRCMSKSGEGIGRDCIYKSAQGEAMDMSASYLGAMWHGAIGKSALVAEQSPASMQSRDSHVKLRIKSFRVPELFIELPETATVGSLKKAVMDAVTALLGGGLHIGLLLQGKKIRDDGKTLLQSGITHDDGVDTLAFSLEPNLSQVLQVDSSEDRCVVVTSDEPQPVLRYPAATSTAIHERSSHASSGFPVTNLGKNFIDSDHDSAPSPAENSADKSAHVSRVLVAVPEGNAEPLAAVPPINQRRKRPDMAHRRIRRPFSIAEVEALVHAVEKLGTGRWRDVKLRAFDHMRHRTYVDLKDKWKTLVHTTRIPPQQRRGEPVPQELLDRVTVAQAYWSKQQAKHQHEAACLLS